MASRKLTPGEISSSVEKIRKRYDEYISKFFKPKSLREAFEKSYIRALRAGVDVSSFLLAEISAIEELIEREEKRVMAGPRARRRRRSRASRTRCWRKTASASPSIPTSASTTTRGRRCGGSLGALSDAGARALARAGHGAARHDVLANSSEMLTLDSQLRFLSSTNREEVPQVLGRLGDPAEEVPPQLRRHRPGGEGVHPGGRLLPQRPVHGPGAGAARLHGHGEPRRRGSSRRPSRTSGDVISDFRLKDFKRKRRGGREES